MREGAREGGREGGRERGGERGRWGEREVAGPSVRRAAVAVDAVCGRGSAGEDSAAAAGEGSHAEFASVLGLRVPEFPPAPRRMCDWTCELGGSACIEFALFLSVRVLLSFIFCIFQCSHTAMKVVALRYLGRAFLLVGS